MKEIKLPMKKSFLEFMSLCEAAYDKDVAARGFQMSGSARPGGEGRLSPKRTKDSQGNIKSTAKQQKRMKAAGGGKMVPAKKYKLSSYMRYGSSFKNLKTSGDKVLGDCLEAIIGAIFMDSNFNLAEKFVLMSWKNYLNKDKSDLIDSKTKLQEFSLKKYKKLPTYLILKDIGSKTNPFFQAEVKIPESKKYIGTGKSKKIAQQNAAKNLLKDLNIG